LDSKQPLTTRKVHIRRLYDILQLSIQRHDVQRATRVWSILSRCKEINWPALWTTRLHILGEAHTDEDGVRITVDYLRSMMLQYPQDREAILKELVFRLVLAGKCKEALDELELYLPSFPYQDNPALHIYAGLISLYLAQPTSASARKSDSILLRDAQTHFDHAKALDPNNHLAEAFLKKISILQDDPRDHREESDDDSMFLNETPGRKRIRT